MLFKKWFTSYVNSIEFKNELTDKHEEKETGDTSQSHTCRKQWFPFSLKIFSSLFSWQQRIETVVLLGKKIVSKLFVLKAKQIW